ncbi:MAG: gene transfer agent family protein [Pseudomonadota bacterium]
MTKAANSIRGEADFEVAGASFVLRPSFDALVAAEQELGSLFELVERASEGRLKLAEITGLLWHCLPESKRPSRESVGEAVLTLGLVKAAAPIRTILAQVLQGRQ